MNSPVQPIRILIADDHAMFREALRGLIEVEPGFTVVAEAADGDEAFDKLRRHAPDLMLLDLAMPKVHGLEVLRRLQEAGCATPVLVLAALVENDQLVEALKLGARGVLLKEAATELLFKGIRAALAGEYWIGHREIADLVAALRLAGERRKEAPAETGLTPRELEIVAAIKDGCTNKEIARMFSISENTVKHHLTSIFRKSGVSNRLDLALSPTRRKRNH